MRRVLTAIWRIIQDMKKIYQIYKATAFVREVTIAKEKADPGIYDRGLRYMPTLKSLIPEYAKRTNRTQGEVDTIFEDAVDGHYLLVKDKCLRVAPGKGTDLLDTVFGLPIGLAEAQWERHGGFIVGCLIGLTIPSALTVVKWAVM